MSPLYHYVIVRADLPVGVKVAQTIHAAGESVKFPILSGTYAVALQVPDECELRRLAKRFQEAGICHHVVVETDGEFSDQMMAIGLEPTANREGIRRLTSSLPLVR